jgi:16S rRNA (uracil1498-N3)-methyltransferase
VPRFFVLAEQVSGGRVLIEGDDAAHLARALRAAPGERVVVADSAGFEHGVRLSAVTAERVDGEVEWSRPATGEPRLEVHVVQAIAKEGMDDVVEALAEVGAAEIWPVLTRRTVARPDPRRAEHRVQRWRAIARNAAGLAGRGRPPVVHAVRELADIPAALPADTRLLACAVDADMPLARLSPPPARGERIAICIGPEGGLSADDLHELRDAGAGVAHLGPRVLRARLAGAVAVSLLLARAGELDDAVSGYQPTVTAGAEP